jgi:hypothetical protein
VVRLFLAMAVDVKTNQVVAAEGTQEMEQVRQEQVIIIVPVRVDIVLQMEE